MPQVGRVGEFVYAYNCITVIRAVEVPVFFCLSSSCSDVIGGRITVRFVRFTAEVCQAK